ncbi:MAG: hypothetical protein ACM31E_09980 [Fibrobacterota bacterium]
MENPYRSAALQILNIVRNTNRTQHVYREVDSSSFNKVSHRFYRNCQKRIEQLGFQKIADIEDVTLRGLTYTKPTFIRLMGNPDLKINAAIYEVSTDLFMKILSFFRRFKLRIYEFSTHFANDFVIETTIASPTTQNVKIDTIRYQYGGNRSVEELFNMHKSKHDEIRNKCNLSGYFYADSVDSFTEYNNRLFELKKATCEKKGWVSKEYLFNQVGKNKKLVKIIYNEIQEILEEEKIGMVDC